MERLGLAARLRTAKKASKKTLQGLADAAGFSSSQALWNWINRDGHRREADIERLAKLAASLGVSLTWLATGEEK